jgi:hypothetical protein
VLRATAGVEASRDQITSTQDVRACHFVILFIGSPDRTGHGSSSSSLSFALAWSAHHLLTRNMVWFQSPHPNMPNLILEPGARDDVIAYIVSLRDTK